MIMSKSLLVTRPNHDMITNYMCEWSDHVISTAREKLISVYDLKGRKANRNQVQSYLKARQPNLVFLNGHGNDSVVCGYNDEVIFDKTSPVASTMVYARSCNAGRTLGSKLAKQGATFIGYKRKFILGYLPEKTTNPKRDQIATYFLKPSNLVVTTLIKGHTAQIAHQRSLKAMYKNFRKMLSSNATNEERYAARWLWSNLKCQVVHLPASK